MISRPLIQEEQSAARQKPQGIIDTILVAIIYLTILIACFNTVLRLDQESPLTLYYAISPAIFGILLISTNWFIRWTIVFTLILIYGVIVGWLFGVPRDFLIPKMVFFYFLLVFVGGLRFLQLRDINFNNNISRLIWVVLLLVFGFAVLQAVTGFRLPNTSIVESMYFTTFFYTANDVALYTTAALAVIIMRPGSWWVKAALFAAVFALNSVNDARAAFTAMMIIPVVFYATRATRTLGLPPLAMAVVAALVAFGLVLSGETVEFQVGGSTMNLYDLIGEPVRRIVQLQDYNLRGSLYDRSDALIIGIREYISTLGFGLGPGGTTFLLSLPQHRLVTAESLHNAVAELLFEMGYVFLIPMVFWIYRVMKPMAGTSATRADIARFAFLCGLPFLSVTQSSGFISNYASWIVIFLVIAASGSFWGVADPKAQLRRNPAREERVTMPWEVRHR